MNLPPLNALRAFEAAGRHQSFLLASKEMHVSSASVSRFVKMIEADLGQLLFFRHTNGVTLTEAGEQYLLAIQPSLQNIARVSEETRQQNSKAQLTILAIPAIAEIWLVSRLWSFQQQYKNIQINLKIDDQLLVNEELIILNPHDAVIALNHSSGQQAGIQSYAMPQDRLTLVCNQDIAQSMQKMEDVFNHPLLIDIDWQEDWLAWLQAAGLDTNHQNLNNCQYFERYSMVLHAALAGSGVAIGHTTLLQSYLETGALVAPFEVTTTTNKQFYALTANNTQQETVKKFISWFVQGEFC